MIENTHYATSFPPDVDIILVKMEFLSYALLRWKLCIISTNSLSPEYLPIMVKGVFSIEGPFYGTVCH